MLVGLRNRMALSRALVLLLVWLYSGALGSLLTWGSLGLLLHCLYGLYQRNLGETPKTAPVAKDTDVVVITGCDQGLGYAVANKLAEHFTVVASVLDDKSAGAENLKKKKVNVVKVDFTKEAESKKFLEEIEKVLDGKKLYGLVNNAGRCIMGEFAWLTPEQLDTVLQVNLVAPVSLTKALLPRLIEDKSRVVNVTGVSGSVPSSAMSIFCASKFGLEGFTDSLRMDVAKHGVRVITVRPGDYTRLSGLSSTFGGDMKEMWDKMDADRKKACAAEFHAFCSILAKTSGQFSADNFDGIRAVFEDAMLSEEPLIEYEEGNTLYLMACKIVAMLPKCLQKKIANRSFDIDIVKYLFDKDRQVHEQDIVEAQTLLGIS